MWRRERLGGRDADELRITDGANAINPDGDHPDSIDPDGDRADAGDPDCHGVPDYNRSRSIPATSHDDELQRHDNVRSESRCCRGRSSRVAERRIEQHAMGLDRVRNSRGGGPHRRNCLVVAQALRSCEAEGAGARTRVRRVIFSPS
jgi:hypothetical protein